MADTTTTRKENRMTDTTTWDDLCPHGAIRHYEGDDPHGFAAEMLDLFGFDVTQGGEVHDVDENGVDHGYRWGRFPEHGFSFLIPAGLVEAVYGSERWPLGS